MVEFASPSVRRENPLERWLRSAPGLIADETEEGAIRSAFFDHFRTWNRVSDMTLDEFRVHLKKAGYLPAVQKLNHSTGKYRSCITLPEGRGEYHG